MARLIDAKEGKKVFLAIAQPAEYKGVIRSMMVANRNADMRHRKKAFLRNKERAEADRHKKGKV